MRFPAGAKILENTFADPAGGAHSTLSHYHFCSYFFVAKSYGKVSLCFWKSLENSELYGRAVIAMIQWVKSLLRLLSTKDLSPRLKF